MKTYKFLSVLILFAVLFSACKNDDDNNTVDYDSVALITGLDWTTCNCCGNWVIVIEGEPEARQFVNLPSNSEIDLSTAVFPISVSLNWDVSTSGCDHIIISDIIEN